MLQLTEKFNSNLKTCRKPLRPVIINNMSEDNKKTAKTKKINEI